MLSIDGTYCFHSCLKQITGITPEVGTKYSSWIEALRTENQKLGIDYSIGYPFMIIGINQDQLKNILSEAKVRVEAEIATEKCPDCKKDIPPESNFCPGCGASVESRE